eukprot:TRINITY_DN42456_c0_g1_i1.p1 TRINITY_DN42456_c0_g1~~TRINITY_DN42456_c0_g1_i1.p1  ORF type:complete len:559 (+),score=147.22 TRINITY_DN42456_c0_g1_i1:95-1771(+)
MAGMPEADPNAAASQFPVPAGMDPQQMQQVSAMMAMAAAGMSSYGSAPGTAPPMPPPATGMPAPGAAPAGVGACGAAPPFDQNMAQAYTAMFQQYFQQAQVAQVAQAAQAAQAYAAAGGQAMNGMAAPPMPFPAAPYEMPPGAMPPQPAPAISVAVEGMKFQYQLTEDDLLKVFSRYGSVTKIRVDEAGTSAEITFQDFPQAQAAMADLNGKILNGLDGTLRLNWAAGTQSQATAPYNYWNMPPATPGFPAPPPLGLPVAPPGDISSMLALPSGAAAPPAAAPATEGFLEAAGGAVADFFAEGKDDKSSAPAHVKGVKKYTCRFLIGIENDKDFQVVRRIIGAKGSNMKKIVKQTDAKLRLRGVGSGYFEGAGQKESSEPLQLCVSCTSGEGYRMAVKLVEELLEGVYAEYRQHCRDTGKPELDLHALPQLVSTGGRGGGGGRHQLVAPGDEDDDEDDNEGDSPDGKKGRRRGRRSRGGKAEVKEPGGVEKGDPPPKAPPVDEIEKLIDQRNEARRQCNFQEADRLRQLLNDQGVALMDDPGARGRGTEVTAWRYWRE